LKISHIDDIGVPAQGGEDDDGDNVNASDFKKKSQYSSHMKEKSQAVSTFARTKTMKEQREYLPVYGVRNELLQTIRENQIVIIVGETGSGKTTQLTQYVAIIVVYFDVVSFTLILLGTCSRMVIAKMEE